MLIPDKQEKRNCLW